MAKLKQIKFGQSVNEIAKTIVNGKGVIKVTNTGDLKNDVSEQSDYSYDIDVNVDGSTIVTTGDILAVGTVTAPQVSVAASAGLIATDAQAAFEELKDKIDTVEGAAKSYTIVKKTEGLATNVKEQYLLQDEKNAPVGAPINIYKDSSLKSVELVNQDLVFTYILDTGEDSVVSVDVSTFLAEEEFRDGLVVTDHFVKVKVDETSEKFLTVGEAGVKLSGVQTAINAAVEALDVDDAAVAGQYVSAVSETDGKVAITRANVADAVLNGYAKGVKPASGKEAVAATDDVKGAIAKLEHQVDAAKAAATTKVEKNASASHLTLDSATAADGSVTYTIGENDIASATALSAETTAREAADTKLTNDLAKEVERATAAEDEIKAKVDKIKYNVSGTTLIVSGISKDETLS